MPSARQVFSASIVLMLGFVAAASIMVAPEWADAASADTIRFQPQLYTQDEDSEPRLADTLEFEPLPLHSQDEDSEVRLRDQQGVGPRDPAMEPRWLQHPFRLPLSSNRENMPLGPARRTNLGIVFDYNRVDEVRTGLTYEYRPRPGWTPRLAGRIEYTTVRHDWLYGVQVEQPLQSENRVAVGFSAFRKTGHIELQQVSNIENSLALLLGRQDYRDYFDREGFGGYLALRWPGVTTFSLHARNDDYRSLETFYGTTSWFHANRDLRENPPIEEGESHLMAVRFERMRPGREGFHHWVEFESSGGGLGGDFDYRRLLADVRNVFRLSPSSTLTVRGVAGSNLDGHLPPQRGFTVGGVDGLRAHSFAYFHGDQVALGQLEYSMSIGKFQSSGFESGIHGIVFLDTGRAWNHPGQWDVTHQPFETDAGFGLSTSEETLRIYFAKNLQDSGSDIVVSARLQRPF